MKFVEVTSLGVNTYLNWIFTNFKKVVKKLVVLVFLNFK